MFCLELLEYSENLTQVPKFLHWIFVLLYNFIYAVLIEYSENSEKRGTFTGNGKDGKKYQQVHLHSTYCSKIPPSPHNPHTLSLSTTYKFTLTHTHTPQNHTRIFIRIQSLLYRNWHTHSTHSLSQNWHTLCPTLSHTLTYSPCPNVIKWS